MTTKRFFFWIAAAVLLAAFAAKTWTAPTNLVYSSQGLTANTNWVLTSPTFPQLLQSNGWSALTATLGSNATAAAWRSGLGLGEQTTNTTAVSWRTALGIGEQTTNTTATAWRTALALGEQTTNTTAAAWRSAIGLSTNVDLFIIGGQSNAQGAGTNTESPTLETGVSLTYYGGALVKTADPVGNAVYGSAWPAFAKEYFARTRRTTVFVPAAYGGTAMIAGGTGVDGDWSATGTHFTNSVALAQAAGAALTNAGYTVTFKGILWSQGEMDAIDINLGTYNKAAYKAGLAAFVGRYQVYWPDFKLYIFQTGTRIGASDYGSKMVRDAQEEVADADDDVFLVFRNAINFPARGLIKDTVHYTQAGYNEMGTIGAMHVTTAGSGEFVWNRTPNGTNIVMNIDEYGTVWVGNTNNAQTNKLIVAGNIELGSGYTGGSAFSDLVFEGSRSGAGATSSRLMFNNNKTNLARISAGTWNNATEGILTFYTGTGGTLTLHWTLMPNGTLYSSTSKSIFTDQTLTLYAKTGVQVTTNLFVQGTNHANYVRGTNYLSADGTIGGTQTFTIYGRTSDNAGMVTNAITFKNGLFSTNVITQ